MKALVLPSFFERRLNANLNWIGANFGHLGTRGLIIRLGSLELAFNL